MIRVCICDVGDTAGALLRVLIQSLIRIALALSGITCMASAAAADSEPLLFAQSAPTSGPAQALGQQMRLGIRAAFQQINRTGGISGRMLQLQTLDDQYEPESTIENVKTFINNTDVVALIGGVGTPTSKAVLGLVEESGIAYVAPLTGAAELRDESLTGVLNVRASYDLEVLTIIRWLLEEKQFQRIGILYQEDSYGRSGLASLQQGLQRENLNLTVSASYLRNTTAVKSAVLKLADAQPQAVLIVGTYKAAAEFIRWSRKIGFNPLFVSLSFVGSEALAQELGPAVADVYVSQVVPSPQDTGDLLVASYRKALVDFDGDVAPSYLSLEGYLAGRVAVEVLRQVAGEITRDSFYQVVGDLASVAVEGITIPLSRRQGADRVYLTKAGADGVFHPVP